MGKPAQHRPPGPGAGRPPVPRAPGPRWGQTTAPPPPPHGPARWPGRRSYQRHHVGPICSAAGPPGAAALSQRNFWNCSNALAPPRRKRHPGLHHGLRIAGSKAAFTRACISSIMLCCMGRHRAAPLRRGPPRGSCPRRNALSWFVPFLKACRPRPFQTGLSRPAHAKKTGPKNRANNLEPARFSSITSGAPKTEFGNDAMNDLDQANSPYLLSSQGQSRCVAAMGSGNAGRGGDRQASPSCCRSAIPGCHWCHALKGESFRDAESRRR